MDDPALSDEEAAAIRDICHRWAEFALAAYVNTEEQEDIDDSVISNSQP
jgi:hypothetical protein